MTDLGNRERAESEFSVPAAFVDLARDVILHRSADRVDLLYRLLWRLRDEPDLMKMISDRDVAEAMERAKTVSRASHKMKAFVRFRQGADARGAAWVAWCGPPRTQRRCASRSRLVLPIPASRQVSCRAHLGFPRYVHQPPETVVGDLPVLNQIQSEILATA